MKNNKVIKYVKDYISVVIASIFVAIAIHTFILPNSFVPGGVSGIATVLEFTGIMQSSLALFVLNLPLLAIALWKLDKQFAFKTIIASLLSSGFKALFEMINFVQFNSDRLISSIIAGILFGLAMGITYTANASNGGTEILARVVQKSRPTANPAKLIMLMDICIMIIGSFLFDIWALAYSLIMSFVCSQCMDMYINGFDPAVNVNIITDKPQELYNKISPSFKRGVTSIDAVGYVNGSDKPKTIVNLVVQQRQMSKFRKILKEIDPDSFAYTLSTSDILREKFNARYK